MSEQLVSDRSLVSEVGQHVLIVPDDYLDARREAWAVHEQARGVVFSERGVQVEKVCVEILRVINAMYPGKYPEIAPLLAPGEVAEILPA